MCGFPFQQFPSTTQDGHEVQSGAGRGFCALRMGLRHWRWNFVASLCFQCLSLAQDLNPSCTSGSNQCQVPGQSCVFSFIQSRQLCGCPGNEFAAGVECQSRCPAVDGLEFGSCSAGTALCTVPCNYPFGECNYVNGKCVCSRGYLGANCTAKCPGYPNVCSGRGNCVLMRDDLASCVCDVGFRGQECSTECPGGAENTCEFSEL